MGGDRDESVSSPVVKESAAASETVTEAGIEPSNQIHAEVHFSPVFLFLRICLLLVITSFLPFPPCFVYTDDPLFYYIAEFSRICCKSCQLTALNPRITLFIENKRAFCLLMLS